MTTSKTTYTTVGKVCRTRTTEELLVVTKNEPQAYTKITTPLVKNDINIVCYTSYVWGDEVAFRVVTDDNSKARELYDAAGFNVQINPVVLWYTENKPGALGRAAVALANVCVNTYCCYTTSIPYSNTSIITFSTSDVNKTVNILNEI